MLKVNYTLVLTVSALTLSAGNASASFSNPPLASVLCTKLHTSYNSHLMQSSALNQSLTVNLQPAVGGKLPRYAKVCFITDEEPCSGNEFGKATGDTSGGGPIIDSGDSDNSGTNPDTEDKCDPNDSWCVDNSQRCEWEGYRKLTCLPLERPYGFCPYDSAYFEKCVCRSDLVYCPSPLEGVGESCDGKYQSCRCPSNYTSCECGKAAGASSCTWNGVTKYSSCKACCSPYSDEQNCSYGTYSCSDGCGGTRQCCSSAPDYGGGSSSDGSGSSSCWLYHACEGVCGDNEYNSYSKAVSSCKANERRDAVGNWVTVIENCSLSFEYAKDVCRTCEAGFSNIHSYSCHCTETSFYVNPATNEISNKKSHQLCL